MPRPIPREHGAWAMLATPFCAALLLARRATWESLAAALALLALFLAREPLVILGRQAWVWRGRRPESAPAARWLAGELTAGALAGAFLLWRLPAVPLAAMGGVAAVLMAFSTWMTVHNRQRSVALQLASAAGLSLSAPIGWLAARGSLAPEPWWLAGVLFAHSAAAVLVVHARLDLRVAARSDASWRRALAAQAALVALAVACVASGRPYLAASPLLAAGVHLHDLLRMRTPEDRRTPLTTVGLRAMTLAIICALLAIAALW